MKIIVRFPHIYLWLELEDGIQHKPIILSYFTYVTYCRKHDLFPDDQYALEMFCILYLEDIVRSN